MRKLVFLFAGVFIVTACKEDHPEPQPQPESDVLKVTVQPVFGGQLLSLDSTYSTVEGYDVQFTDLQFFAQDIRGNGNALYDAAFFDYRNTGIALFQTKGKPSDANALTSNLGIAADVNHSDPSAFPTTSPLNIVNASSMHWSWNTGYIFLKVEARVDTIPDGIALFDHNVVFHIGQDANLQQLSYASINWQQTTAHTYVFPLKLDMATFLQNGSQGINLKTEYSSHSAAGQENVSLKVMQNFAAALTPF